ncbi:GNAT family N-acetyltransferase [Hungatella sp.]|uniref:GNAT family N-acetyltransferase n=1 Tax=Hungatella sp. TaxID=2613924 RepID=UPI003AB520E9
MGNVMGENTDDEIILETKRLVLRRLRRSDYGALCLMLKDEEVMYAYEHAFEDWEAADWLDRQLMRYETYGFGLWAVVLKETGEVIGQCGLTMQEVGDSEVLEVGYLFRKEFWHHGYALEAAAACRDYAFEKLGAEAVYSIIRENNGPSRAVAERNGMTVCGSIVKHYYGLDMPHLLYRISRVE